MRCLPCFVEGNLCITASNKKAEHNFCLKWSVLPIYPNDYLDINSFEVQNFRTLYDRISAIKPLTAII
jgi:alkyl hydroperoxide reductase subunit AhpC